MFAPRTSADLSNSNQRRSRDPVGSTPHRRATPQLQPKHSVGLEPTTPSLPSPRRRIQLMTFPIYAANDGFLVSGAAGCGGFRSGAGRRYIWRKTLSVSSRRGTMWHTPAGDRSRWSAPGRVAAGRPDTPAAARSVAAPGLRSDTSDRTQPRRARPAGSRPADKGHRRTGRRYTPARLQAAHGPLPDKRSFAGGEVLPDRLAAPARVPADRRLIPATRSQSMYLHVVLLCELPTGGPSRSSWRKNR